jgi:hypothetical protein
MVSLLMDHGANLSYQNEHGNTALHEAALNGRLSVVRMIVSGKDKNVINLVNTAGETPLIIAVKNGEVEVAFRLICAGADYKWKAINGETALSCAQKNSGEAWSDLIKVIQEEYFVEAVTGNYTNPFELLKVAVRYYVRSINGGGSNRTARYYNC